MQWFKGTQKIKEGAKFTVKYIQCGENEFEVMLEIAVRHIGKVRFPYRDDTPQKFFFYLFDF